MTDELAEHLNALARDDNYRVDSVLKDGALECTQRVFFTGTNGAEMGPFIRKSFDCDAGLGLAYERLLAAQRARRRFLHLPRVLDCYSAGEKRVVIMEYVPGETLADLVYRLDPSPELAARVFPQLCRAVRELHEGFDPPIIHRDLKPSNVIIADESLTIIDLSIARTYDDEAEDDTRHFGTRVYAPPEQFGYSQTDARSDVYALGLLLYFCLTEKTPDAQARRRDFASPLIPEPLRRVIARAAAFDPAQRFPSVAELQRAFEQAIGLVEPETVTVEAPRTRAPREKEPLAREAAMRMPSGTEPRASAQTPACNNAPARERPAPAFITVRNVAVLLVFGIFFAVVTEMIFAPRPGQIDEFAPLWLRLASNYTLLFLLLGPAFYLALDRRRIKERFPRLGACPPKRERLLCLAIAAAGFVAVGIMSQFFPTS
ncbi:MULTISPECIES: serine/threonine-protein kinase [unclassified Adlercreutzia]|uniref:serine/threonine protein kinase n=1 Tax=unclassified Adlercreutzia TaxID=2636013 RepID=UPI0013EA9719|nr:MULTISPECIES: serine/threonine-protein kinase [unclassified Adlercreutzia]